LPSDYTSLVHNTTTGTQSLSSVSKAANDNNGMFNEDHHIIIENAVVYMYM